MQMYCGCGTKSGKMRWISVVALIVLGIAFWIMYGVEVQKCDICDKVDGGESINCQSISAGEPVELNDNEKGVQTPCFGDTVHMFANIACGSTNKCGNRLAFPQVLGGN